MALQRWQEHIASKLRIPDLSSTYYEVDNEKFKIERFWYGVVHYDRTQILISTIQTNYWIKELTITKGLIGQVISESEIRSAICNLSNVAIPVNKVLSNLDVYSDWFGGTFDSISFSYTLIIKSTNQICYFKADANTRTRSQEQLGFALINTAQLIAEKSADEAMQLFMDDMPYFDLE